MSKQDNYVVSWLQAVRRKEYDTVSARSQRAEHDQHLHSLYQHNPYGTTGVRSSTYNILYTIPTPAFLNLISCHVSLAMLRILRQSSTLGLYRHQHVAAASHSINAKSPCNGLCRTDMNRPLGALVFPMSPGKEESMGVAGLVKQALV